MKKILVFFILCIIFVGGWILYQQSLVQSSYNGLPTVPCIDTTQPIRQSFTFHVSITIHGKPYIIPSSFGHDYGKCLHDIYVDDTSGTIHVETNGNEKFTLGDFFTVWHQTFDSHQIFSYQTNASNTLQVFVNGKPSTLYNHLPITPNADIHIVYN